MKKSVKKEIEKVIKEFKLNCSIKEFKDNINWSWLSANQALSEDFIREFKGYVNWLNISIFQILSLNFIREFQNELYWNFISKYQKCIKNLIFSRKKINFPTKEKIDVINRR